MPNHNKLCSLNMFSLLYQLYFIKAYTICKQREEVEKDLVKVKRTQFKGLTMDSGRDASTSTVFNTDERMRY